MNIGNGPLTPKKFQPLGESKYLQHNIIGNKKPQIPNNQKASQEYKIDFKIGSNQKKCNQYNGFIYSQPQTHIQNIKNKENYQQNYEFKPKYDIKPQENQGNFTYRNLNPTIEYKQKAEYQSYNDVKQIFQKNQQKSVNSEIYGEGKQQKQSQQLQLQQQQQQYNSDQSDVRFETEQENFSEMEMNDPEIMDQLEYNNENILKNTWDNKKIKQNFEQNRQKQSIDTGFGFSKQQSEYSIGQNKCKDFLKESELYSQKVSVNSSLYQHNFIQNRKNMDQQQQHQKQQSQQSKQESQYQISQIQKNSLQSISGQSIQISFQQQEIQPQKSEQEQLKIQQEQLVQKYSQMEQQQQDSKYAQKCKMVQQNQQKVVECGKIQEPYKIQVDQIIETIDMIQNSNMKQKPQEKIPVQEQKSQKILHTKLNLKNIKNQSQQIQINKLKKSEQESEIKSSNLDSFKSNSFEENSKNSKSQKRFKKWSEVPNTFSQNSQKSVHLSQDFQQSTQSQQQSKQQQQQMPQKMRSVSMSECSLPKQKKISSKFSKRSQILEDSKEKKNGNQNGQMYIDIGNLLKNGENSFKNMQNISHLSNNDLNVKEKRQIQRSKSALGQQLQQQKESFEKYISKKLEDIEQQKQSYVQESQKGKRSTSRKQLLKMSGVEEVQTFSLYVDQKQQKLKKIERENGKQDLLQTKDIVSISNKEIETCQKQFLENGKLQDLSKFLQEARQSQNSSVFQLQVDEKIKDLKEKCQQFKSNFDETGERVSSKQNIYPDYNLQQDDEILSQKMLTQQQQQQLEYSNINMISPIKKQKSFDQSQSISVDMSTLKENQNLIESMMCNCQKQQEYQIQIQINLPKSAQDIQIYLQNVVKIRKEIKQNSQKIDQYNQWKLGKFIHFNGEDKKIYEKNDRVISDIKQSISYLKVLCIEIEKLTQRKQGVATYIKEFCKWNQNIKDEFRIIEEKSMHLKFN